MFRKYPLTWLVVIAIHILCLFPVPETPLNGIAFIDKWTHLVMFGGLSITFWYEYLCQHGMQGFFGQGKLHWISLKNIKKDTLKWRTLRIWGLYFPTFLGGWIEILQATCTNGMRSGDVVDWIADTLGVVLVWGIMLIVVRNSVPRRPQGNG